MIVISYDAERAVYLSRHDFADNPIIKKAGFWFDGDGSKCGQAKRWFTRDITKAATLADYADDSCRAALMAEKTKAEQAIAFSRATDADVDLPCPAGLSYLGYQRAGIAFAGQRQSTLIGDEPGLGKTVMAAGVMNVKLLEQDRLRVLIVCPNSLKFNWRRELTKWLIKRHVIGVVMPGAPLPIRADIVIINYDVVAKNAAALKAIAWDVLVFDEAHLCKNEDSQRTVALLGRRKTKKHGDAVEGIIARATTRIALTGTPIVNRPVELWPIISALDPTTWTSFWAYAKRYCGATLGHGGRMDTRGASNLDELQDKLRSTIMIRRLKRDVLTDLPPKRRQIIEISDDGARAVVDAEHRAAAAHDDAIDDARVAVELSKASDDAEAYKAAVARLATAQKVKFQDISLQRHAVAVAKIPAVLDHLHGLIDDDPTFKVIVFAWHRDVIEAVRAEFASMAVEIHGDTPAEQRQEAVDRFQTDRTCRVFVGSITAAGVGLTLTAASTVVFAELDWVPGNVTQCEDRAHRIGQRDSVLVQHIVLEGSLDAKMAATLVAKQEIADQALDQQERQSIEPVTASDAGAATTGTTRKALEQAAVTLSPDQVAAVHAGLRGLAGVCDGAAKLDGSGFSRIDVQIGHSLAMAATLTPKQAALGQKLLRKYQRQIDPALLAAAGVDEAATEAV